LAIDLDGNKLYWADHGLNVIQRDNLDKSNLQTLFNAADGLDTPLGVATYGSTGVTCYPLTRDHTGQGNNPSASPAASTGCANGKYTAGQSITLTAAPAAGWQVSGWSGTNNDGSTTTTNTLTMPAANHAVSVIYQLGAINYDFFVPFVTHVPFAGPTCYSGPDEGEDNDSHDQATGPLCQGTFLGLPNDQKDFFYFDTKAQGNISVVVTGHRGEGVQLQLYYGTTPLDDDTEQEDGLSVAWPNGAPGRYYVILYTETPKPNETRGYSLQVSYP
jgi:hypothetical protein